MRCCPKDLMEVMREFGLRADITMVRNILKDNWGLTSQKNGEYSFYHIGTEGEIVPVKRKGRYLEIALTDIDKILL
jgi:DNA mismatch repair protein MutH